VNKIPIILRVLPADDIKLYPSLANKQELGLETREAWE